MFKLLFADLKMMVRNRQALFWSFMFPLMFTVIFGFFFGKGSSMTGAVALVNRSDSELAKNFEKTMEETELFQLQKEEDTQQAKDLLKQNKIVAIVEVPEGFGNQQENAPREIKVIDDPANAQANSIVLGFVNQFLVHSNFQVAQIQPMFSVKEEKSNNLKVTYFDFILIGMLGMALMNSSIQGVGINMAKYREDKILKRITTTPLKTYKFIISEVISRLILNFFQISLILTVGVYLFDANLHGNLLLIYLMALVGAILFQSFGFVVAALSKTTAAAEGMATAIAIPMMFLAGVFFPIDQLPKWLYSFVQYLPLAPLLRIMRGVALESKSLFDNPANVGIVLIWIVVLLSIAIWKFKLNDE